MLCMYLLAFGIVLLTTIVPVATATGLIGKWKLRKYYFTCTMGIIVCSVIGVALVLSCIKHTDPTTQEHIRYVLSTLIIAFNSAFSSVFAGLYIKEVIKENKP